MSDRVVIISGGSRGLGLALVRHFLAVGDCVATFSRSRTENLTALAQDASLAPRLFYQSVDATSAEMLRGFVKAVYDRWQRIDALVNNAGIAHDGVLATMQDDQIDQMLQINLRAALVLARECSRFMLLTERGAIVNVSSIVGEQGFSGLAAYSATKAGMLGMTRALARELGPRNIRVNAVAPGFLETEMSHSLSDTQRQQIIRRTPLGRLGRVEDVVSVIDFLLSPQAEFITGQTFTIDGGATA